jgi:hypothetical protein
VTSVNNTQPDANGNVTISTGGNYTAGTGIDITNDVISVTSPTLTNTSTGNHGLTIYGNGVTAAQDTVNIGYISEATSLGAIAIGSGAKCTGIYSTQIGYGKNTEHYSFYVSTSSSANWKMLGSDGIIPDARISSNIARTSDIPAAQVNSDWNASSGVAQILNKPTDFTGADGTNAGTHGFVPAPAATDNSKYLRGDGTWTTVVATSNWGNIGGTLSNQTDLNNALNAKANDSDVVKLTGDQTIAGTKTFAQNNIIKNTYPFMEISNSNLTKGTDTTETNFAGLLFEDKNADGQVATRLGDLVLSVTPVGDVKNAFKAWNYKGSGAAEISVVNPATGTPYATAPTPATSDNSTKIATTAWVRNLVNVSNVGNRYSKIGDMIIQWGEFEANSGYTTITFPTPFKKTNYALSLLNKGPSNTGYALYKVHTRSTTKAEIAANSAGGTVWIAIGE